jgi:8-oxo-dGTP pyrophosphatase MutT (NUDIX family)
MIMSTKPTAAARLKSCRLAVVEQAWSYAIEHAALIDAYWQEAVRRNPALFNGEVVVLDHVSLDGDALVGTCLLTRFAAYLHWRDHGYDRTYGQDGFACAIVTSADGQVLLAEATAGTLNEGLCVLPGGMIDRRDVTRDGTVDIHAAARREVVEETGLGADAVEAGSELYVAFCGPLVGMGVPFRSELTAARLKDRIRSHLAAQDQPELIEPFFARPQDIIAATGTPEYVRVLLAAVCGATQSG